MLISSALFNISIMFCQMSPAYSFQLKHTIGMLWGSACVLWHACGGQRTTLGSWFSSPTLLRLSACCCLAVATCSRLAGSCASSQSSCSHLLYHRRSAGTTDVHYHICLFKTLLLETQCRCVKQGPLPAEASPQQHPTTCCYYCFRDDVSH